VWLDVEAIGYISLSALAPGGRNSFKHQNKLLKLLRMKSLFTTVLLFAFASAFSQNKPPTVEEIRQGIAGEIASFKVAATPVAKIENIKVWTGTDSLKVRLYYPDAKKKRHSIIYQIHGGALVGGDLNTHDNVCRLLAARTSSIVVAVDYRKPPESPYPAGVDDCISILNWITRTAASWSGDLTQLTLLGDSGGGLLATALLVKEQGRIPIKKVVLINPAVDLRNAGEGLYGLVSQLYLNGKSANDSLTSPILATNLSFAPPTLIVTSEKDILKSQGVAWYGKLQKAGVMVSMIDIPGEDHLGGLWSAGHPKAKQAIDETIKFINGEKGHNRTANTGFMQHRLKNECSTKAVLFAVAKA